MDNSLFWKLRPLIKRNPKFWDEKQQTSSESLSVIRSIFISTLGFPDLWVPATCWLKSRITPKGLYLSLWRYFIPGCAITEYPKMHFTLLQDHVWSCMFLFSGNSEWVSLCSRLSVRGCRNCTLSSREMYKMWFPSLVFRDKTDTAIIIL